jgi:hypothetical protein
MSKPNHPVSCSECRTPVAEIQGDLLIIKTKHHGEWHTTAIKFTGDLDIENLIVQMGITHSGDGRL